MAIRQAANAVSGIPNSQIGTNLSELADALSQLQGSPTSATLLNRVQYLLGNLGTLIQADQALASFAAQFQPSKTAAISGDVAGLLSQTAAFFNGITPVLTQEAKEQFTVVLTPTSADIEPNGSRHLFVKLTDTGSYPETLNLNVGSLPSGVTVGFGQSTVSLTPNQTITVQVTLSQTLQSATLFNLDVTAKATVVKRRTLR